MVVKVPSYGVLMIGRMAWCGGDNGDCEKGFW